MKKIPVGIDDFKKLIEMDAYYIDKTKFVSQKDKHDEQTFS